MEIAWVRRIDKFCREEQIPHFFKRYYIDDKGIPCEDGILDEDHR